MTDRKISTLLKNMITKTNSAERIEVEVNCNTSTCSGMIGYCYYYPLLQRVFLEMRFTRKNATVSGKQRIIVGTIKDAKYRPGTSTALSWASTGWDAETFSKRESLINYAGEIIIAQYNASNPAYWYVSGNWTVNLGGGTA